MDGEIDYSKYVLAELLEAKRSINARQFPKNFANLEAAIAKLQPNPDEADFDSGHPCYGFYRRMERRVR